MSSAERADPKGDSGPNLSDYGAISLRLIVRVSVDVTNSRIAAACQQIPVTIHTGLQNTIDVHVKIWDLSTVGIQNTSSKH